PRARRLPHLGGDEGARVRAAVPRRAGAGLLRRGARAARRVRARLSARPAESRRVITEAELERVAAAAAPLPPAAGPPVENDFVTSLLETVLDYQLRTGVVVAALEFFAANRRAEIRTLDDLERVAGRFPEDKDGDMALAVHLWGYRYWTRAGQLRSL